MTETPPRKPQREPARARQVSTWTIIKSTLAAAIGVQSEEARRRDFTHGRAGPFIIAGLIGTALFVLLLVGVVQLVLTLAG